MPEPTVLTVILNYRTPAMTLEAVEAALREMAGIAGEIVVVDNDSRRRLVRDDQRRGRRRRLGRGGRVRVVAAGRNGGYGAGNNVGIRAGLSGGGRPDYVYILNSDAFPDAGAIRRAGRLPRGATPTSASPAATSTAPTASRTPPPSASRRSGASSRAPRALGPISRLLARHVVPLPIPEARRPVDWLAGASVMMRRTMLDAIGLFDERFFLYFDETDLCRRGRDRRLADRLRARERGHPHRLGQHRHEGLGAHPDLLVRLAPALLRQAPRGRLRRRGDGGARRRRPDLARPDGRCSACRPATRRTSCATSSPMPSVPASRAPGACRRAAAKRNSPPPDRPRPSSRRTA